ncbi:hypothetical protein HGA88_00965 [Candidatus Roizmanbacteria bacterium]|nr:hypothetical protein [Candidatus Roizmanbacteria bacterium]
MKQFIHPSHKLEQQIKKHLFDYLLLVTAGVLFLFFLQIFNGEKLLQFIIFLAFTSFYIIWGVYHHVIEDSVHLKSLVEYILIGFTILFIFLMKFIILP